MAVVLLKVIRTPKFPPRIKGGRQMIFCFGKTTVHSRAEMQESNSNAFCCRKREKKNHFDVVLYGILFFGLTCAKVERAAEPYAYHRQNGLGPLDPHSSS